MGHTLYEIIKLNLAFGGSAVGFGPAPAPHPSLYLHPLFQKVSLPFIMFPTLPLCCFKKCSCHSAKALSLIVLFLSETIWLISVPILTPGAEACLCSSGGVGGLQLPTHLALLWGSPLIFPFREGPRQLVGQDRGRLKGHLGLEPGSQANVS